MVRVSLSEKEKTTIIHLRTYTEQINIRVLQKLYSPYLTIGEFDFSVHFLEALIVHVAFEKIKDTVLKKKVS